MPMKSAWLIYLPGCAVLTAKTNVPTSRMRLRFRLLREECQLLLRKFSPRGPHAVFGSSPRLMSVGSLLLLNQSIFPFFIRVMFLLLTSDYDVLIKLLALVQHHSTELGQYNARVSHHCLPGTVVGNVSI